MSNLKEEILKEARKQIYAIIGLEKDIDGEDNKLLITNEDDEVLEAIDFTQEINDIVKFISSALDKQHKADMKEVRKIVESIDDNGGGSGRRLKIQLLNKLKDV